MKYVTIVATSATSITSKKMTKYVRLRPKQFFFFLLLLGNQAANGYSWETTANGYLTRL